MDHSPLVFVVIIVALFPIKTRANCATVKNVDYAIKCLLDRHPELSISEADLDVAQGEIDRSSQMINPSLEWLVNETQGSSGLSNEINLKHTIELGSKRSARKNLAFVQKDIQILGYQKLYNKIKIDLILDLYRLRQIEHESEVIEENQATFRRMISQYKRIGRMNPEQEISVNIFTMAAEEVRLKLQKLKNEKDSILSEFEVIAQKPFKPTTKQLPPIDHKWPELVEGKTSGVLQKEAKLKVDESDKNFKLERAKAWPNLSIGPRMLSNPGPQGGIFLGAAVSLNLPVLNLNSGGKNKARAQQKSSELRSALIKRRIAVESRRLQNAYKRSSESYTKAVASNKVQKKHERLHGMIKRGVVSPPLVIELHRQAIEFFEALHQQELEAVKARWLFYSLFSNLDTKTVLNHGGG